MSSGLTYYFTSQSLMVNFGKPYIWKMSFMNNKNTKSSCFFNMEDFKSISLCKCIYKLIAKIITNMIRGIFSTIVSSKQFDFLEGRHIHDAIGITHLPPQLLFTLLLPHGLPPRTTTNHRFFDISTTTSSNKFSMHSKR